MLYQSMSGDASEGTATFNASNSNLTISEDSDSYSSAPFFFITNNEAKKIELNIDSTSKLTLTGNTYVTTLNVEDTSYSNIDFNGYTLYVNGEAIN